MNKQDVLFDLDEPLIYSSQGQGELQTKQLIMKAPSSKQAKFARGLKQKLMFAMMALKKTAVENHSGDDDTVDDSLDMAGKDLILMLMSVGDKVLDWPDFCEWFLSKCSDVIFVDEKEGLKSGLVDKIDIDTQELMIGEYLANFTWPTLMNESGKEGSAA